MARARRVACTRCGHWNHPDVAVCPACGVRHPGLEGPRERVLQTFWPFAFGAAG
jgi:uncharacterized OB-fold protein